jgi:hypothetical protein
VFTKSTIQILEQSKTSTGISIQSTARLRSIRNYAACANSAIISLIKSWRDRSSKVPRPITLTSTTPIKPNGSLSTTTEQTRARSPAHARSTPQSYMQPEPSNDSQKHSPPPVAPETTTTSHHGLRDVDQPSMLPHHHEEPRDPTPDGGARRGSTRGNSRDRGDADEAARLSPTTPSPRNRIAEYENALTESTKRRNEGPAFEVIKLAKKPDDRSCAIAKLPNGTCMPFSSTVPREPCAALELHCSGGS